jgi:uncharacterized membrane protein YoaK (UPF0700 family)
MPSPHPAHHPHWWTDSHRSAQVNLRLGASLSFVAGAINAGGFLAVGQYTSHMTGMLSSITDHLALGEFRLALAGLVALLAFVGGAVTTAWMVNWSLRRQLRSAFARPLVVEAGLLLVFGLFGAAINLSSGLFIPLTVLLLCFIMGLQNALITKISNAEIRTTHVTGLVTDIGIELGKLLYFNGADAPTKIVANRRKLRIHLTLAPHPRRGRRPHRGCGGAAAGHGVCDCLGPQARSRHLHRHHCRLSDLGAGRQPGADRRPGRRLHRHRLRHRRALYGVANLIIATAMSGVLLFLMGLFKLGTLIRFIPIAVVIGFTNGIAVLIALSQVKDFLGLKVASMPADFFGILSPWARTCTPSTRSPLPWRWLSLAVIVAWQFCGAPAAEQGAVDRQAQRVARLHRGPGAGHAGHGIAEPAGGNHRQQVRRHSGGAALVRPGRLSAGSRPGFC